MITKIGNFRVQYNYQAISIALIVMSKHVCTGNLEDCKNGDQDAWVHSSATAAVFADSIVGQLTMGYAGDVLGRSNAMGLTVGLLSLLRYFLLCFLLEELRKSTKPSLLVDSFLGLVLVESTHWLPPKLLKMVLLEELILSPLRPHSSGKLQDPLLPGSFLWHSLRHTLCPQISAGDSF